MKHTNQKLKLIGILISILILAGIILIVLTGNKVNILKTQVAEETGKITQETETAKVYDAYMLINELSKIDGTDLNGNGNGIKITTSADDLTLKAYSVVNDELISENENKDIIVPESGIKLKVEGITEGKTYDIEIANGTTDAEYKTDFVKAVITIDATGEDSLVAYVKEITKVVNGEEITEEGSKEETAIFMYEDETNKIKIKGNGDLEMYYTLGNLDGLTEEELKTATWKEYDKTNGLEVEHNCKIYAKSKYKTGEYSDISEIRVDNIDKLAPTITVTGKEEKAEESTSVTVKITDEENEKYGASGIVAYKMTKMETEPKEWIEIENTKEYETEIGEIQKNGTYYLWAKDKVGNVGHVSFDVTNIEVKVVAVILDSPVESLIGTEYTSLEALQTALEENNITAESGKVVIQLENNVYYETMKIANKDITIDLNGYMIKAKTEEPVIDVESGKVNLVDGKYKFADYITNTEKAEELAGKYTAQNDYGKIINETGNGINIEEGAEFTLGTDDELISIASPEIKAGETGIHNNNGTFNFYDGIITAKITNDGSTTVEGEKVETGITDTPRLYDPTTRQTEGEEGKYTTYLAKVSGIEAVIGKTRYTKLEYAIEAANDLKGTPETQVRIDIVKDINKDASIEINNTKNIILNLNGYTLTNSVADYVIKNAGKLEITDTTVEENHVYDNSDETTIKGKILTTTGGVIDNQEGAELTITEGTIYSSYINNSSYTSVINNNSKLTINGGYIKVTTNYKRGIYNLENGTVEINGGKMYDSDYNFRAIENAATGTESAQVIINNTEITAAYGSSYIYNADNGIIDIKGGIFNIDLYQYGTGTMNISGGKNTWTLYNEKGTVNISNTAQLRYIENRNSAVINMDGGEISSTNSRAIYARSNSIVNISNSKITSSNGQAIYTQENSSLSVENSIITSSAETIYDTSTAGIKIKNSTITSTANSDYNGYVIRNSNSGTIEIDNSVINSTNQRGIYNENSGTIKIQTNDNEGKMIIQANKEGIFNGANGTIVLGVKDGEIQNELIEIDSNTYGLNNNRSVGIIKYYDGTIVGKNKGILGVINDIEDNSEITLSIVNEKEQAQLGNNEAVCYIGENDTNTYDSIASAIENIETEGKITLLKNVVISANNSIEIPEEKKITLDINGKEIEIHKYEKAILNDGELIIQDNVADSTGKIFGYANNAIIYNEADKVVTIESGKISYNQCGIDNQYADGIINNGNLNIKNGKLETTDSYSNLINSNGTINYENGTMIIKGKNANGINSNGTTNVNEGIIESAGTNTIGIYNSGELIMNAGQLVSSNYYENKCIENIGKVNIKDGTLTAKEGSWDIGAIVNYKELYIEGGEINSERVGITNSTSGELIGKIKITGGKITTKGKGIFNYGNSEVEIINVEMVSEAEGIYNYNNAKIQIEGGSINAKCEGIYNNNRDATGGEVKVTGGKIISREHSGINNNNYYGYDYKTTVTVTGGEIKTESTNKDVAYSSGIYNAGVSEVILGENDEGVPSQESPKITGATYGIYNVTANNKFYFYDGIITGKENQSIYGKITKIPDEYTIQKYKNGEKENLEVTEGMESAILEKVNVAKIESTGIEYTSLRKAINAVTESDVITILQNIEIPQTDETIEIPTEKNITINLNERTITASNQNTITNNGMLTITDSEKSTGTIFNNVDTVILNNEGSTLNINNGNIRIKIANNKNLINNKGTVNINGGTIESAGTNTIGIYNSGELIMNAGQLISSNYYENKCIENIGKVNIKDGILTAKEGSWDIGAIVNYKELYIEGGEINSERVGITNSTSGELIGKIKITGGKITTKGKGIFNYGNSEVEIINVEMVSEAEGIYNYNNAKIQIEGGSINAKCEGIYNNNRDATGGEVKVTGGKIISREHSGINNNNYYGYDYKTTVTVTGGEIKTESTNKDVAYSSGIYNAGVSEVILGENDEGVPSQESPKITGATYGIYNVTANNKFYFYDGIITGKENQSIYGKITKIPDEYTIQKYKNGEKENLEVTEGMESAILEKVNVAKIESTGIEYTSLRKAINAVTESDVITILQNIEIPQTDETIEIPTEKNITINLNERTITASNQNTITNNGMLAITDTEKNMGIMLSNFDTMILNNKGSTLNINNGNIRIKIANNKNLINNKGTVNINGGTIESAGTNTIGIYNSGELIMNAGQLVSSNYYENKCIENIGKVNIKDGILTAKEGSWDIGAIVNYKELYIEGGEINSERVGITNSTSGELIGKIKITGGKITTKGKGIFNYGNSEVEIINVEMVSEAEGIYNYNNAKIQIEGGSINAKCEGIYNNNRDATGGEVKVTGGKIISREHSGINNNNYYGYDYKTTVTVTGGEIKTESTNKDVAYSSGIYNAGVSEVILGENDEGVPSQESPKITGTTYGVYNVTANNKFYFYDGIITGETLAIYGTVTGTPESYVVVYKDSSQKIAVLDKVADFDNQICVDGTYYDTLDSAIAVITNKANKTGRILLYSDVELLTPATIPEGVNITLEMQGQRMLYRSGTDAAITNNGNLTIIDYADLSDGDSDTISSIENTQGIAIQNNGTLTIGQANNNNMTSPKIIGTTAIAGNEATKLSGTITNTNSTVGMAQNRQIAKIQKMEENNQTANDTKTKLSSTPDLIVESTEWTKENVPVGMRADITPILNLYLVENIKTAEYKVEYYYDGKIDESKTFTDEVDIGTQINSYEDKVKEGYVLEKVEGMPLTVEENTDNNVIKVYYTKRIDLSYTVNYLEKGTNKIIHESKTVTDKTYGDTVQATQEIIEIDGYNYESSDKETLTITTEGNEINIYYIKKKDLRYTVNYLEKETNNKLHESKVQGNMTYESTVISNDEVIEIEGYNYDSVDKPTISITTGTNEINIYYTKRTDLSYIVNYQEKETNKTLLESKIVKNQTYGTSIDIESEKVEINGYNYDSTDKTELIIGTDVNVLNIYYTKKNDLSYTVNYLEKGTNKVLYEAKTYNNQVFETKINAVDEAININGYKYDSSSVETLTIGTGENVINIYYTKVDGLSYTINYLEKYTNKVLHEPETKGNQTYENEITSRNEVIEIDGYNYESADPETLVIGTTDNIINIYYTKKNDLSYTVNYLEKDTDKVLHEAKVVENKTFEDVVTSSDEIIEIDGYNYNSVDPESLTITTGENIINIYYTKRNDLSYTVNYLEKDTDKVLHEAKVIENKTFEDVVISSDEIIEIDGYNYDSVDPENLTITTGTNIINIYYTKRNDLSYTVKYIDRDTKEEIQEEKIVTGKTYKETVNAEEEKTEIYGYNYETADPEVLTIEVENNVINLYYTRKTSTVVIKHCEEGTEQQISENVVITGKVGEKYKAEIAEDIPEKYEFTRAEGETEGTITEEPQTITMYYSKKATKVIVNYINEETQEKMKDSEGQEIESIEIEGKVDDFYTTVSSIKIPSKYELVEIPENSAGRMTIDEITVNYYYRRKETRVVVHHYEEGTTNKLSENVVITGKVDDTYETKAATDIPVKYEYAYVEGDTAGIMTEEKIEVIYYYKVKDSKLTVRYVDKNHDTEIIQADETIGKVDDKYETQAREIEGYTLVGNSENTEGTLKVGATEVIYYYKKNTAVQVKYIDIDTNKELSQETIEGLERDEYQTESKNFEKYVLVKETENTEGTMTREEIIVKYYYEHLSKGVIEKHIDITTNEILENKVYTGKYGTPYTTKVKTIEGYDVVEERLPENAEGTMIEDVIEVNYYYIAKAKINVEYIDRATGKSLIASDADQITIIGHEGDTYQTEEKTFEGYDLIEIVGNAEGTMTKGETTIKYIYARPTKVIVRYIDQITGKNLVTSTVGGDVPGDPITIIGHEGDAYQTEEKTITGYDLVKTSENTEGRMTKEDIEVTYYYIAKTKVVVNYIDRVTGESLITSDIDPIIITGHEGDTYKTESKTFAGYDLVKTSENTEGRMTKETIEVTYYYARPAKVIVNYLDEETGKTIENIKEEIITGYEGDSYKTEAKELEYYRVARTSENTEGIMEVRVEKEIIDNTTIVNYYYKKKDYNFSIEKTLESVKKDEKTTEITGTIGKVELTKGQLKTAKVQVVYNIKVKNTGEIAGKVKVLEKIPAGMKMNKEDNPGWEISNTVATIETNEIEPGKEENIKVVLTWINSETNLGTIENIAEIQDTSSKSGFKDNNSKDDTDKADIIVAISTGEKTYMSIMGVILIILSSASVVLVMKKNN